MIADEGRWSQLGVNECEWMYMKQTGVEWLCGWREMKATGGWMNADEGRWRQLGLNEWRMNVYMKATGVECGWRKIKASRVNDCGYEANWGWTNANECIWSKLGLNDYRLKGDESNWRLNECGWREMKATGVEWMRMNVYEGNWGLMNVDEGK